MLEIRKSAVAFDERNLIELERIITDDDDQGAMSFLKKQVYDCIVKNQQGRLKSHLDSANPIEGFMQCSR